MQTNTITILNALRICRLVWGFPRADKISYGLGPNFYYISKEQINQNIEVDVIARRKYNEPHQEEIDGIRVYRVEAPYNINAMKKLYQLNEIKSYDIIHAHGTCGISYPFMKIKIRRPLVVHSHATGLGMAQHRYFPSPTLSVREFLKSRTREYMSILRQKTYWKLADMLLAVSHYLKDEIIQLYDISGSKIEVAYNGVDMSIFKKVRDVQKLKKKLGIGDKKIILYVGHFGFRKGILYLIEALPKILKEEPDAFLLCVGGTPEWLRTDIYWRVLTQKLKDADLMTHVKLVGQVPHQQLPAYYSMADVFAFPSLYESMGKVIIEAMACETPIVASRVGGIREIIREGENGILIEPKNVIDLQKAILTIFQDSQLARKFSHNGRKTVESRFTWEHTVMQISMAYKKLIYSRS